SARLFAEEESDNVREYYNGRNGSNLWGGIGMTEKVKITREQAKVIESKMAFRHMSIKYHVMNNWDTDYEPCLNNLTLDELIRAFYIVYEVEPIFEVGDWVKDTSTNAVIKINDSQHRHNLIVPRHTPIRHATPEEIAEEKQRRWWAKHGREVWELSEGAL